MDQCRHRIVVGAGKGRAGGSDITDEAADVLRMVKQIECSRSSFGYVEVLCQRNDRKAYLSRSRVAWLGML